MKSKRIISNFYTTTTLFILTSTTLIHNAVAGPEGGMIVGGSGNISQSGLNATINQNTSSLAIDWNSFNVNSNERVQFIQPNVSSIALNRILGSNASQINGRINVTSFNGTLSGGTRFNGQLKGYLPIAIVNPRQIPSAAT